MKKEYIQPTAEILKLFSLDDFLNTSYVPSEPSRPQPPELEDSKGEVLPGDSSGIW